MSKILVGTSGFSYKHWSKGIFYPADLAAHRWFEYYCKFFNTTELNVTFYRLPQINILKNWYKHSPKNFLFAAKGSRFITHIKRLKDCRDPLRIFLKHMSALKEKLFCLLWQLPPGFKKDLKRLDNFLTLLNRTKFSCRQSLEFRHESWFSEDVYELLKKHRTSLCIADSPQWPCEKIITSDFLYLRFHGANAIYGSCYRQKELSAWSKFAKTYFKTGKDVLAYFNNDRQGYAVKNALQFKELLLQ